ncbi:MAG: UvrD-helicase domain-containing protein, partial [Burkholderiales bacterium]|nr:UvrD-helicase domain-containing protein [Burkholderiales bacterium]
MTNNALHVVADIAERERAIDVSRSFIVRAPAGSGKTRLLIQRYLALLAQVNEPEEIVAITFTRKAAAEMRQRVLDAFASVEGDSGDEVTRRLAAAALVRNTERGWQIIENASRLRTQTIDALNASITRQMPLLARFGAQPETINDASALYAEAARDLLLQVNDTDANAKAIADDVATLLTHLDNNVTVATNLLSDVLRSRDHWLRNLSGMHERESLEATLSRVRVQAATRVAAVFPDESRDETLALARFAGQNMPKMPVDKGLYDLGDLVTFPVGDIQALPVWLALTELLLTKTGTWRKVVNKNQGFPVGVSKDEKARCSAQKSRMNILLASLASNVAAASALHQLRSLPAAAYSESQWQILGAIVRLLPHATVSLWREFGRRGQCDFTEIAEAASRALGHDDAPTDLALALDYRISHLLVDEFQDTSFAQFEMLEKLTRGWSEGDGRTLFLVGDPMQSIYRFREAEVSLFSRAWWDGVGGVRLNRLTLSVNFRSCAGVVAWVNNVFDALMPADEDSTTGAVPYSPSVAFSADQSASVGRAGRHEVTLHPYWLSRTTVAAEQVPADAAQDAHDAHIEEAHRVVEIIATSRREKPDAVVAILVRNRGHLREIVPALKAASITFRAVDIDPLNTRPVVQDLLSITRALLHP